MVMVRTKLRYMRWESERDHDQNMCKVELKTGARANPDDI